MKFTSILASLVYTCTFTTIVTAFSGPRLICLINRERVSRGLRPLILNGDLSEDAQHHSQSQANRRQMTHRRSDRPDMGDVARSRGYNYRTRAENVAAGDQTEESVVYKWMHSEGMFRLVFRLHSFIYCGSVLL
ncbi:hypothetical protein K7432_018471 [Basidiobolus ranarum]|uniref:SCP domain-containing protein n=1 Tax=Basidiobolus ranarum TaxID=34480 RepID=A0ABR2VK37_9FUNG